MKRDGLLTYIQKFERLGEGVSPEPMRRDETLYCLVLEEIVDTARYSSNQRLSTVASEKQVRA